MRKRADRKVGYTITSNRESGLGKDRIRHYGFAFEGKRVLIG